MRTKARIPRQLLILTLGLLIAIPGIAAAAPRRSEPVDVCLGNFQFGSGPPQNTIVLQDVQGPLNPGRSTPLHGLFFTGARRVAPVHGSAAMASDGTVRLGLFVHSSAASTNDFTLSGLTDMFFAGVLNYDADGDFRPDATLTFELVDCATITIP